MMRRPCQIAIVVVGVAMIAQLGLSDEPAKHAGKSNPSFELIKKLSGDWVGKASHGGEVIDSKVSYRVTSAGSAVVETLFGGTEHEMISMYHLSGNDLLMTHYCAAGNQPRMKATRSDSSKKIEFKFLDGTNLDPAKDLHMHDLTIEFVTDDHIKTEWVTFANGKARDTASFELRRVKNP
jgi:hypothetical protein